MPYMMLYHDGLRTLLPKRPATAQTSGTLSWLFYSLTDFSRRIADCLLSKTSRYCQLHNLTRLTTLTTSNWVHGSLPLSNSCFFCFDVKNNYGNLAIELWHRFKPAFLDTALLLYSLWLDVVVVGYFARVVGWLAMLLLVHFQQVYFVHECYNEYFSPILSVIHCQCFVCQSITENEGGIRAGWLPLQIRSQWASATGATLVLNQVFPISSCPFPAPTVIPFQLPSPLQSCRHAGANASYSLNPLRPSSS